MLPEINSMYVYMYDQKFLHTMSNTPLLTDSAKCRCRIIRNMNASFNFRSRAIYNNVVYSVAGHVVEQLGAGRSWESLLRELVLDPLNMTQTSFYHARDDREMFARPYLHPHSVTSAFTMPSLMSWVTQLLEASTSGRGAIYIISNTHKRQYDFRIRTPNSLMHEKF